MKKIKLIWDFKGSVAAKTAEHHCIHLSQYIKSEKIDLNIIGFENKNDLHAIAYMVVYEQDMIKYRDILKPHRGELFIE